MLGKEAWATVVIPVHHKGVGGIEFFHYSLGELCHYRPCCMQHHIVMLELFTLLLFCFLGVLYMQMLYSKPGNPAH